MGRCVRFLFKFIRDFLSKQPCDFYEKWGGGGGGGGRTCFSPTYFFSRIHPVLDTFGHFGP